MRLTELADVWVYVGQAYPWVAPMLGALLGAVAGSFLTCALARIPRGISLWHPPSQCDTCQRTLGVVDLIPIVSWVVFQGKCRKCNASIGSSVVLWEIVSTAVGAGLGWWWGLAWSTFPALLIGLSLYATVVLLIKKAS